MKVLNRSNQYRSVARDLAAKFAPKAAIWDRSREYCWENVEDLADAGLMGMTIPKEYGGQSATYYHAVLVIEEIARACALSARIVVESNMGGISAIMAYALTRRKDSALLWCLKATNRRSASLSPKLAAPPQK